jgi:hypothetical protein
MTKTVEKEKRVTEIQKLIEGFCSEYLDSEYKKFSVNLLEKLSRKRTYSITRGKKEIWASSIIYVIARLNFLFDRDNDYFLTADQICDHFGTNKKTVSRKATEIEKAINIQMGEKDFCHSKIHDSLTLVQLSNGMIVTRSQAEMMGVIVD